MLNFVMTVGLPYSGKSTLASSFLSRHRDANFAVISSDAFTIDEAKRRNVHYNDIFEEYVFTAMQLAEEELMRCVEERRNIFIDQTNLTRLSRYRKLVHLPDTNEYKKTCLFIPEPSHKELQRRKKQRTSHVVPDKVLDEMRSFFERPMFDEGFDTIYHAGFDDIFIR
jgi:predicted kinase